MKKVLGLLVVLILTGCGGDGPKVTVCKGTSEGVNVVNTIEYEGDKVNSITYENSVTVDESLVDIIKESCEQYQTAYGNITGLTYNYEINGGTVKEKTIIDYGVADLNELAQIGLVSVSEENKVIYIGYELTLDNMTELGLTCTEE